MEELYISLLICIISFTASVLTFFSGFGLGTMLLPVFCLFMPVELAVLATAVVHLLNNLLKFFLIRKMIDRSVLISFGIAAVSSAFLGALFQDYLGSGGVVYQLSSFSYFGEVELLSFVIGILMIGFAILDFLPWINNLSFRKGQFFIGGLLSGFFGGLSGHQGAFRAAFLSKSNLSSDVFISTSVCLSLLIDMVRIPVYLNSNDGSLERYWHTIILACVCAFLGSFIGKRLFTKRKVKNIRLIVAVFLFIMGAGMILGFI